MDNIKKKNINNKIQITKDHSLIQCSQKAQSRNIQTRNHTIDQTTNNARNFVTNSLDKKNKTKQSHQPTKKKKKFASEPFDNGPPVR